MTQLTFQDECAASKALIAWLRSQNLPGDQAIMVLTQTFARIIASGSAGGAFPTLQDINLIDQANVLIHAYTRSFMAKVYD